VDVESYNVELEDDEGFVGDRASKGAFRGIIERWRKPLRDLGHDPFGEVSTDAMTKKRLDGLMAAGDPEAAGVVHGAIEQFAQELALVTRRFLKLKGWKDTERIVFGGGFSGSRVGELAIGRASVILKADKIKVEIVIIRSQPDEAGLLGAVQTGLFLLVIRRVVTLRLASALRGGHACGCAGPRTGCAVEWVRWGYLCWWSTSRCLWPQLRQRTAPCLLCEHDRPGEYGDRCHYNQAGKNVFGHAVVSVCSRTITSRLFKGSCV
jgi:hypothetical protein